VTHSQHPPDESDDDRSPQVLRSLLETAQATSISLLERGLRNPSLTVVSRLARALGVTMAALVGELEER
jgi:transcriptional regulator with XRE-family HTH domain